jgi:hypothetical protein
MSSRFGLLALLTGILALSTPAASQKGVPPLSVTFEANAVVVGNATPGGDVITYGMSRTPQPVRPSIRHYEGTLKASVPGGQARFDIGDAVPSASVWIFVDQASGRFTVASPTPALLHELVVTTNSVQKNENGDRSEVELPFTFVDVLLVRPGVGQWSVRIAHGGANDTSPRSDGKVSADLKHMKHLAGKQVASPNRLEQGDVLIGLEPFSFRYFALRIE